VKLSRTQQLTGAESHAALRPAAADQTPEAQPAAGLRPACSGSVSMCVRARLAVDSPTHRSRRTAPPSSRLSD